MIALSAGPWRERLIAAFGILGALLLVTLGRGAPSVRPGPARVSVTVVASDAGNLDCASAAPFGHLRCGFDAKGAPVEVIRPMRPYVSTAGELLLISGAFEAPEVARWLERTPRKNAQRVTLRCSGTFLGRIPRVGVRMRRSDEFKTERHVAVVTATHCSVKS
jgi:hypothetical protein